MRHLRIRTPEGVGFAYPLAGPVARGLAYLIDISLIGASLMLLSFLTTLLSVVSPDLANTFVILGLFVVPLAYGMLTEGLWKGQTCGKRIFRLRVVDAAGLKLRPTQVILRNLLRAVDFLPFFYLIGGVSMLVTRRGQRLGDIAAGTVVVRLPNPPRPDLDQLIGSRYNSLRAYPHLASRLRQKIPAAEAALALQALVRREEIEAGPRVTLFQELAGHFREQVEFPAEVVDGLTDEQYVRNVVDLLYRPRLSSSAPPVEAENTVGGF